MSRLLLFVIAVICCVGLIGCDFPEQRRSVATPGGLDIDTGTGADTAADTTAKNQPTAQTPSPSTPSSASPSPSPSASTSSNPYELPEHVATSSPYEMPTSPTPQPTDDRRAAQVGDGAKGHYRERFGRMSIFDSNIGTMYRMRENLTYNVQIPHAMNLYHATNGRYPQTHEEFTKEILDANNIKLPELKAGHRYEYNPQKAVMEVVFPIND